MDCKLYFTENNIKLKQYFDLRGKLYFEEYNDPIEIDEYDVKSHHLIIENEYDQVVGGARITPKAPGGLLMEEYGIALEKYTSETNVCEIGRVAIEKKYRSMDLLKNVFEYVEKKCKELEIPTLLVVGNRKTVRLYAIMCSKIQVDTQIIQNVRLDNKCFLNSFDDVDLLVITIP